MHLDVHYNGHCIIALHIDHQLAPDFQCAELSFQVYTSHTKPMNYKLLILCDYALLPQSIYYISCTNAQYGW